MHVKNGNKLFIINIEEKENTGFLSIYTVVYE